MKSKGIDADVALAAGVRYRPSTDELLFPRHDYHGVLLGYKARNMSTGRFRNTPAGIAVKDTVPFKAGHGKDVAYICEGETDALAMASVTSGAVYAVPGATSFPNEWASLFAEYDSVYLIPDPDPAGEKLTQKVCGLMPRTRVVRLPEGKDVCDVVGGGDDIFDYVARAVPIVVRKRLVKYKPQYEMDESVKNDRLMEFVMRDTALRRRGSEFVGRCPFHDEDTPSFFVNPKKHLYYCHGCGVGGDVISYVRKRYDLDYKEARAAVNDGGSVVIR